MITKEQAMRLGPHDEVHFTGNWRIGEMFPCTRLVGPRGGVKEHIVVARVTGQCKYWVRDPERFELGVCARATRLRTDQCRQCGTLAFDGRLPTEKCGIGTQIPRVANRGIVRWRYRREAECMHQQYSAEVTAALVAKENR